MKMTWDKHNRGGDHTMKAQLEFNSRGFLKAVFLCGKTDAENIIMSRAIEKLINRQSWPWFKRLLFAVFHAES